MTYEVELRLPSSTQYAYANITVKADTAEALEAKLAPELISWLANIVGAAESTANAVFAMAEGGLVKEVQSTPAPVQAGPTPPWKQQPPAAAGADTKPWLKAQAGAPMQAGNTAPANDNTFRVSYGYMDGDKFEEFKKFTASFYTDTKNSFSKPKGEDTYRFFRKPTPEQVALVKEALEYFGGTIVSE